MPSNDEKQQHQRVEVLSPLPPAVRLGERVVVLGRAQPVCRQCREKVATRDDRYLPRVLYWYFLDFLDILRSTTRCHHTTSSIIILTRSNQSQSPTKNKITHSLARRGRQEADRADRGTPYGPRAKGWAKRVLPVICCDERTVDYKATGAAVKIELSKHCRAERNLALPSRIETATTDH